MLHCVFLAFVFIVATTGSPSSKYEHRRASALLRNIQNIRICMGKKPIVSVVSFMGFYVNGFLSLSLYIRENRLHKNP